MSGPPGPMCTRRIGRACLNCKKIFQHCYRTAFRQFACRSQRPLKVSKQQKLSVAYIVCVLRYVEIQSEPRLSFHFHMIIRILFLFPVISRFMNT